MKAKYNLDKLVKVVAFDESEQMQYLYRKERIIKVSRLDSFFGAKNVLVPEGIVEYKRHILSFISDPAPVIDLPKEYRLLEDKTIVLKPRCVLYFEGRIQKTFWYESYDHALLKKKQLTEGSNWIE